MKLNVLDRCLVSSLLYASEAWVKNTRDVVFIYRLRLKVALDVPDNINNEIIYIEANGIQNKEDGNEVKNL